MTTNASTTMDSVGVATAAPEPSAAARKAALGSRVAAGIAAIAVLGGGGYYLTHHGLETTDDAQLEGDLVDVSARIPGKVAHLLVTDDQVVDAGDVIASLETDQLTQQLALSQAERDAADATLQAARTQLEITEKTADATLTQATGGVALSAGALAGSRASLDQAQANVRAAKSKLDLATLELTRSRNLLANDAVRQDDVDTHQDAVNAALAEYEAATAALAGRQAAIASATGDLRTSGGRLDAAKTGPEQVANARAAVALDVAKLAEAEANLAVARLNLSYAEVRAPVRGQVTRRAVQVGQMVSPDVPLLSLAPLDDVWVVANFKEDQVARMRQGRPARVTLDTFGSRSFVGHVATLGATSGARLSLLPAENASGNYVKVVQRVPVRVIFDAPPDVPLRLGTSADVTVDVR